MQNSSSIDEYIENYQAEIKIKLIKIREVIRKIVPTAIETISYGIPTFKLNGKNLVHFAAFRDHLSFFPTSSGVEAFKKELKKYKTSRGTIQIPIDGELPIDLIKRITEFRVKEVTGRL